MKSSEFVAKYPRMSALCGVARSAAEWHDAPIVGIAESLIAKVPVDRRESLEEIDGDLSDTEIAIATGLAEGEVYTIFRACLTASGA